MEWIKCSDRMPNERQTVLFYDQWDVESDRIKSGWWSGHRWRPNADTEGDGCIETCNSEAVTHWMPLPDPPKA